MTAALRLIAAIATAGIACVALAYAVADPAAIAPLAAPIIDAHAHTAGIGAGNSGCLIAPELRASPKFRWYLRAFGVTLEELERAGDTLVLERLSAQLSQSRWVARAVVLAMDGVVGGDGELDRARTQVYVPNEFLIATLPQYPNLLFGASINPYRKDAVARLEKAAAAGAVLVKWIPAIMNIDPADPAIAPFYRRLVALDLPLLVHVGQERSFGAARDEFGDPVRLELPLSLGVTIIAAHIATTGHNDGEENFTRILPLFARYPNLYTDISSLTQINKRGYLYRALAVPGLVDRMTYGSDWPLQFFPLVSPWYQIGHLSLGEVKAVLGLANPWDRDIALKRAMGVPQAVFERPRALLRRD